MNQYSLSRDQILQLLSRLSDLLAVEEIKGEIYLVGGAVMCVAFKARESTKDVDAYFSPTAKIREAAETIAEEEKLPDNWLNDAVKGYLSPHGSFEVFLELPNLRVFVASAEYLLALKCLAMRLGPEFHDESDVRYLLRYLNVSKLREATDIITKYYPLKQFPQKTLYALEDLLPES